MAAVIHPGPRQVLLRESVGTGSGVGSATRVRARFEEDLGGNWRTLPTSRGYAQGKSKPSLRVAAVPEVKRDIVERRTQFGDVHGSANCTSLAGTHCLKSPWRCGYKWAEKCCGGNRPGHQGIEKESW